MNWYVGQKVVCVKKDQWVIDGLNEVDDIGPRYGEIVTIRKLDHSSDGRLFLKLSEHVEYGYYNAIHFRPAQDQYTEAEIENVNMDELIEIIKEPEYA